MMMNINPKLATVNSLPPVDKVVELPNDKKLNWRPKSTEVNPFSRSQPNLLKDVTERSRSLRKPKYIGAEPNFAQTSSTKPYEDDESPLCLTQRGESTKISTITLPSSSIERKPDNSLRVDRKLSHDSVSILNYVANDSDVDIDVYRVSQVAVSPVIVKSCTSLTISLTNHVSSKSIVNHLHFTRNDHATVSIIESEMIEELEFEPRPLGMEVTMINGCLICTGILSNSQSSKYGSHIIGGQILIVNRTKIEDLELFQRTVLDAMNSSNSIQMIIKTKTDKQLNDESKVLEFSGSGDDISSSELVYKDEIACQGKSDSSSISRKTSSRFLNENETLVAPRVVSKLESSLNENLIRNNAAAWNFSTFVDVQHKLQSQLVLVINNFAAFKRSANTSRVCFQVFNQSKNYKVSLLSLSNSNILISRQSIGSGSSHVDESDQDEIWALMLEVKEGSKKIDLKSNMLLFKLDYEIASKLNDYADYTWSPDRSISISRRKHSVIKSQDRSTKIGYVIRIID